MFLLSFIRHNNCMDLKNKFRLDPKVQLLRPIIAPAIMWRNLVSLRTHLVPIWIRTAMNKRLLRHYNLSVVHHPKNNTPSTTYGIHSNNDPTVNHIRKNVIGLMTFRPFWFTSHDVSNQPSTLKPCESKPYGYYIMPKINHLSPTIILLRNLSGAQATVCWESPPRNCIYWTWPIKISDFNIISHKKQVPTMTFKQKQND